jgi:hypothetical protein
MLGDWVRVIHAPLSIVAARPETQAAFVSAVGQTLQAMGVSHDGQLELDLSQKLESWDSIYLEAHCCVITRRPRQYSKRFQKYLIHVAKLDAEYGRPAWRTFP